LPSESTGNGKDEGFLKSIWHKLTDKNCDPSKPETKDAKDNKDAGKTDASKDDSKKSS
jgi:molecular chaperone DnaJ